MDDVNDLEMQTLQRQPEGRVQTVVVYTGVSLSDRPDNETPKVKLVIGLYSLLGRHICLHIDIYFSIV